MSAEGTTVDFKKIPFFNLDLPASIAIGYRLGNTPSKKTVHINNSGVYNGFCEFVNWCYFWVKIKGQVHRTPSV